MKTQHVLRIALVLQWVLGFLSIVIFQLEKSHLPEILQEYAAAEAGTATALGAFAGWFALLWLVGSLAASVGAFFFQVWARPLFLATAILGCVLQAFLEPSVSSPGSAATETGAQVLVGLILGLLYFSQLRWKFAPEAAGGTS